MTRVGHLLAPHGVRGAVKLYVIGDAGQLRGLRRLYVETIGWRRLVSVQAAGEGLVVELSGVGDRDAALALRGLQVYAADNELPALPDGEYYYHELRGLPVQDASGALLGEVTDVQDLGHQDLLVVRRADGGEGFVPLQAPYVVVRRGRAIVLDGAPEGLLDGVTGEQERGPEDGHSDG